MKRWSWLAFGGLVLLMAVLFLRHDLRGWTPADLKNPATVVKPTRPDDAGFAIRECVPGTISPWNAPTAEEYAGTATITVLSCRSRSSAMAFALAYVGLLAASLVVVLGICRRRAASSPDERSEIRG